MAMTMVAAVMAVASVVVVVVAVVVAVMVEFKQRGRAILCSCVASQAEPPAPDWDAQSAEGDGDERSDGGEEEEASSKCRPDGMNTMALVEVDRNGAWFFSRDLAEQEVARILTMRQGACARHSLRENAWLPRPQQEDVKKELFAAWKVEKAEKIREIKDRRGAQHKVYRDVRSIYRTWCYNTFGGQEWLWIVIAAGHLNTALLECMNEALAAKKDEIRQRAAAGGPAWVDAVPAAPRDRGPKKGNQHHKSTAKLKREAAKKQSRVVEQQDTRYKMGLCEMTGRDWHKMVAKRDHLWNEAEEASYAAGVEFTDRHGVIQLTKEDKSIVGRAIRAYEARVAADPTTPGWGPSASAASRG
jgi:hypothetical protein